MERPTATARIRIRLAFMTLLVAGSLVAGLPTSAAAVCIATNSGGTAITPPAGCPFVTDPLDPFVILPPAVPASAEIKIEVEILPLVLTSQAPGGLLGGDLNDSIAEMHLHVFGTGLLAGFDRNLIMPLPSLETHYAPRTPGDAVQIIPSDLFRLDGQLFFDPDFDFLFIRGGTQFGLPSPGSTTLTRLGPPGSDFNVESFFDVFYEIDFQGAPGSILEGMGGVSEGNAIVRLGEPAPAPEPSAVILLGLALGAFGARLRL